MADFTKRGDLQWRARVRRRGHPMQSATFETRAEAEAWARDIESRMDKGSFKDKTALKGKLFGELLKKYRLEVTPGKKGAKKEAYLIQQLETTELAKMEVAKIEPADIRDYRNARLEDVTGSTVIRALNVLSVVFNHAISEWSEYRGLTNPVSTVAHPKKNKARTRRYAPGEMEAIIAETRSPVLPDLIPVAVDTTMRRGEMVNLDWADVLFKTDTIVLYDTKNGEGRTVPMTPRVKEILWRRREAAGGAKATGKVFPVQPDSVTQAFGRARDRAREKYVKACLARGKEPNPKLFVDLALHDSRHEGTSQLFEKHGFNIMEAASVTGHKDLRMLRRYTHLDTQRLAERLKKTG